MGKSRGMMDDMKGYSTQKAAGASSKAKKESTSSMKKNTSPRKNILDKVAAVKGKLQNAYNKATGRSTVSMEMDGKTFTGTERGNNRRFVTKVKNPDAGSRKIVDVYTSTGNLKRQRIVDKFPDGRRRVTKSGPDSDAIYQKDQAKLMRKKRG